jgi:hypothetical protein
MAKAVDVVYGHDLKAMVPLQVKENLRAGANRVMVENKNVFRRKIAQVILRPDRQPDWLVLHNCEYSRR